MGCIVDWDRFGLKPIDLKRASVRKSKELSFPESPNRNLNRGLEFRQPIGVENCVNYCTDCG